MRLPAALPLLSLAAALTLSACGSQSVPNSQDGAANDFGIENGQTENAAAPEAAAAVPSVPAPAKGAASADIAPLTEAAATSAAIDSGGDAIARVAQPDGWAWMQRGQIVRTASRDGSRVAYFHRGEAKPYLVQQGEKAYTYSGDRVAHVFGRDGKPRAPDENAKRQADQLDRQARDDHDHAGKASPPDENRDHGTNASGRDGPRDHRPDTQPSPTPTPTPTDTPRGSRHGNGSDRDNRDRPRP